MRHRSSAAWRARSLGLALLGAVALAPAARADIGAYLLFDVATGEVIAEHEATRPWYPASITKLMTVYVAFEAVRDGTLLFTSPVRISAQAHQQPPSRMGFAIGTTITLEAALRIIMTKSANDVSVAIAEAVGGTQKGFMTAMNEAAARLGMTSSHFDNPHGLPNESHVSSARDLALLVMALAREFPEWSDYFSMDAVALGQRTLPNHNALMRRVPGADGMKTGFICASGFNIAATATREGVRLGAVVLGGRTSLERDQRTAELLEKGFEAVETGARVELDGFGDPGGRLAHAPVSGIRPPQGTVAELAPRPDAAVADRRDEVCGAERAVTRYDDGVVATVAELRTAQEAARAWAALATGREAAKEAALRAPRHTQTALAQAAGEAPLGYAPASADTSAGAADGSAALAALEETIPGGPPRALADDALRPVSWTPTVATLAPLSRPHRERRPSDFAPDGFVPSPALPPPHPFEAGLRAPLPARPAERPLGYLGPARPTRAVAVRIGGADPTRPNPLSGTIIGGGPAPRPAPKPAVVAAVLSVQPIDPAAVVSHAMAVREAADGSRQPQ